MTSMEDFTAMDPCEILQELEHALHQTLIGKQPRRVRYHSDTGTKREIIYNRVDIAELKLAIARYQTLCTASRENTGTTGNTTG